MDGRLFFIAMVIGVLILAPAGIAEVLARPVRAWRARRLAAQQAGDEQ